MFASPQRKFLPDIDEVGKTRPIPRHQQGMTIKHLEPCGPCSADGPPVDVIDWRLCRLLESGFVRELAQRLASARAVDIHALLQLVDHECPPELAARILSPIANSDA